jgi:membrane-bound lytic murein transglycosylase F
MLRIASVALIAATIAAPAPQRPPVSVDSPRWSSDYDAHFRKYSKHYFGPFFDWRWFKAQAIVESRLDPRAQSPAGAIGVMQLKPSTFREIRRTNPQWVAIHDASYNIGAAIYYDHYLYQRAAWSSLEREERWLFALAAYNAGPTGILRAWNQTPRPVRVWSQVSPQAPPETRAYVAQIARLWKAAQSGPELRGVAALFEARRRAAVESHSQPLVPPSTVHRSVFQHRRNRR